MCERHSTRIKFAHLLRDTAGASLVEYSIITGVVTALSVAILISIGYWSEQSFSNVSNQLQTASASDTDSETSASEDLQSAESAEGVGNASENTPESSNENGTSEESSTDVASADESSSGFTSSTDSGGTSGSSGSSGSTGSSGTSGSSGSSGSTASSGSTGSGGTSGSSGSSASDNSVSTTVGDNEVAFAAQGNQNFDFDIARYFSSQNSLSYEKTAGPGWAKLEGGSLSGKAPAANKAWEIGVRASDSSGNSASLRFSIQTSKN